MATKQKEYQRLPGQSSFFIVGVRSRLYLAKDHLLRVNSNGWTENYRRFYFTDIQAVVVNLTSGRTLWAGVHSALCFLFFLCLLTAHSVPGRIILGSIVVFFGVKLLINLLRGPTCIAQIQTRIGTERLPSLKRWPKTNKVIETLKLRIDAAQGGLDPADVPRRLAEFDAGMQATRLSSPQAAAYPGNIRAPVKDNSYRGRVHGWTFGMFLPETAAIALNILSPGLLAATLVLVTVFAAAGLTVTALVKQVPSSLAGPVRTVTWFALVHVIICFVGGYILMVSAIVGNPVASRDQGAMFIAMSKLHNPVVDGIYTFLAAYAAVVAVAGLVTLLGSRVPADSEVEASSGP